ncbi:tripartite tricarboxylate transporter permease [Natronorubrum sp. FCH18a]|uniref:tripartite tricarboxylate transporter permease n=1 Tax=Natronorubrum sp. FCH18a TaxID=3447018 RepID=UPI003F516A78
MSFLDPILAGLEILFSWPAIGWMVIGVIAGIIVGALPGMGASLGMAIVLPLTLPLSGVNALILLVGIYSGSMYGGSIAAILINAPGTAGSAATTLDGYPMSRQGKAKNAIAISATSSALGGTFSLITLLVLMPVLIELVLLFQTPEYFAVAVLGLSLIVVVARGSVAKGVLSGAFGVLLATVGIAPMTPTQRYTFGRLDLFDGLDFIAILIGLFAIAEMIKLASEKGGIAQGDVSFSGSIVDGIKEALSKPVTMVKSAYIGMIVGAIPGGGSSAANFLSYGEAMRSASDPDEFGEGSTEGLVASEASNNGTIGGSIIPTISFGIPGSGATAVLLGGLLMHGLRPGPELFSAEAATTYAMLLSILFGNLVILSVGLLIVTRASYITKITTTTIIPMVIMLSALGGIALRTNWVDVLTVFALGVLGYWMLKSNYSVIAFVLGAILGPIAEENFVRSLQLSDGSYMIFATRPITAALLLATLAILVGPVLKDLYERSNRSATT